MAVKKDYNVKVTLLDENELEQVVGGQRVDKYP